MAPPEITTTATLNPPQIQIINPNSPSQEPLHPTTLFLAGPTNVPWRADFLAHLERHLSTTTTTATTPIRLTIYDPTQPLWDATWVQDYHDAGAGARFRAQLDWELARQDAASAVVLFFDARSEAPVSLLELGLACGRGGGGGRAIVGCERAYGKRGNVQAVCARYGLPLVEEGGVEALASRVASAVGEGTIERG